MADITQIKVGSTTYDIKDTSKLPKFTNEWRKEYNAGGTVGYMLIGSFPMYDSNVTIDIDSTTTTTYHGTVIIATQNVSTTSMGSAHTITVYGDPTGTISNAITVTWKSGSRNYNVYFSPFTWSKNFISARGIGQYMGEIDTSTMFTFTTGTAPATTSGLTVVNALTSSFAPKSHNHAASNITSGTLSSDRLPTVPVAKGGTGATTAAGALTNLGITATAAELNKLDGVTATTTELNHVDGVTSNIQTQLNNKAGVTHNQASNTINAMTGYSKPSSTSAIAATDTLNAAIGKLEKAIDGKTSNTGTVTSVGTGVGLTGGTITGAGTVKAKLRSETALTVDSAAATTTSGRVYPVAVDKSGYLSVNVPWTDNNTVYTHPNSGVTAGTYKSVTVNATGHVTGGSNPTTLSGYGITDAAPLSHTTTTSNPHSVTKSQVGLGNVVNTGDSATPTSGGTTKFTTGGAYTELAKKAPTSHASTATTYGIGTSSNYGHVKLSDSTSSTSAASAGIAASPKAVKAAYDLAASKAPAYTYGTTDLTAGTSELATGTLYFVYE